MNVIGALNVPPPESFGELKQGFSEETGFASYLRSEISKNDKSTDLRGDGAYAPKSPKNEETEALQSTATVSELPENNGYKNSEEAKSAVMYLQPKTAEVTERVKSVETAGNAERLKIAELLAEALGQFTPNAELLDTEVLTGQSERLEVKTAQSNTETEREADSLIAKALEETGVQNRRTQGEVGTEEGARLNKIAATKGDGQSTTRVDGDESHNENRSAKRADVEMYSGFEKTAARQRTGIPVALTADGEDKAVVFGDERDFAKIPGAVETLNGKNAESGNSRGANPDLTEKSLELAKNAKLADKSETARLTSGFDVKETAQLKADGARLIQNVGYSELREVGRSDQAKIGSDELKAMSEAFLRPVIKESAELGEILTGSKAGETAKSEKSETFFAAGDTAVLNARTEELKQAVTVGRSVTVQVSEAVLEKLNSLNGKAASTAFEITLNPENLGKITIKLATTGTNVVVEIIAADPKTRELLAARAQFVSAEIQASGITVDKYVVVDPASKAYRDFSEDDSGENGGQSGEDKDGSDEEETETEVSFAEIMEAMI